MSDWSSFKENKVLMDNWRTFLTEDKSPEKVEELFGSEKRRRKKWQRIASGEDEDESPSEDPDTAPSNTGAAKVPLTKTIRNIAHLVTPEQAEHIQKLIIQDLHKKGYERSIQEITATRQPYDAAPRRTPRSIRQKMTPLDLGSAGISAENQPKVKRILDRMLSDIGLEVAFGPNQPLSRFQQEAEPETPTEEPATEPAAEPEAPAEPAAEPEAAPASKPPMDPAAQLAYAKKQGAAYRAQDAATKPKAEPAAAAEPEAAAELGFAPSQDVKISTSSKYGAKATTIEELALQALGLSELPDPNKDRDNNRKFTRLTNKIAQAMKKALQDELGTSLGKVIIYENNQAKIEKLFIEEFQRVLNEKK